MEHNKKKIIEIRLKLTELWPSEVMYQNRQKRPNFCDRVFFRQNRNLPEGSCFGLEMFVYYVRPALSAKQVNETSLEGRGHVYLHDGLTSKNDQISPNFGRFRRHILPPLMNHGTKFCAQTIIRKFPY